MKLEGPRYAESKTSANHNMPRSEDFPQVFAGRV